MNRWSSVLGLVVTASMSCTSSGIKSTTGSGAGAGGGNGQGGGGTGVSGVMDPGNGPNCGAKTFGLQMVPPDLMVVQDKSGSMSDLPDGTRCRRGGCGPMAKWPQMTAAINQVVMQTEATIRWGLSFFPADEECGVAAMPVVPIANMNAAAIATAIAATNPNGATPTQAAIAGASMYMATLADPNPKYILWQRSACRTAWEAMPWRRIQMVRSRLSPIA